MNLPAAVYPVARVAPNLRHACGGVWRLTFRKFSRPQQALVFLGVFTLLGLLEFAAVRDGRPRVFSEWTTRFYLTFLVPLSAFLAGASALRDEMKAGSADYVLTRPVPRPAFVVFQFFSHLVCVQILGLIALAVIVGVSQLRHIPGVGAVVPAMLLAQVLAITAFTAFGFLCGVLTSRFLIVGLFYAAVIEIGLGRIPTQINQLSITRRLLDYLVPLMPAAVPVTVPPPGAWATAMPLVLFSLAMLGVATAVFSLREIIGESARDT
ncbi:MAG TPA: ABC transporter permease subunit [Opitutaceae bacterium]|nr:ABC transporter permease subunit [Opitutaceae bacterium]